MILTNRLFERVPPSRDAKSIFIFCEGARRKFAYFRYFKELDSRINLEVYKLHSHEDNSPLGLLSIAEKCMLKNERNPNPKYNFITGDEVWIVLDIDKDKDESREPQIQHVRERCYMMDNWFLAVSNPCFEVWLYYHLRDTKPNFEDSEKCSSWKQLVNDSVVGGFDSRKHPIYIETACTNAEKNFKLVDGKLDIGSTDLYNLANTIAPLVVTKLGKVLKQIEL